MIAFVVAALMGIMLIHILIVKPCRRSGWKGLGVYIPRLAKGLYRICKEADHDNRTHLITCEFYIY